MQFVRNVCRDPFMDEHVRRHSAYCTIECNRHAVARIRRAEMNVLGPAEFLPAGPLPAERVPVLAQFEICFVGVRAAFDMH